MQVSPEELVQCVKCDILFSREFGVSSPEPNHQKVNIGQRDAVKRALNFTEGGSVFRDTNQDDSDETNSTVSHDNLSPRNIPLPFSSNESLNDIPKGNEMSDTESMNDFVEHELRCKEDMPESPELKVEDSSDEYHSCSSAQDKLSKENSNNESEDDDFLLAERSPDEAKVVYLTKKRQLSHFTLDESGSIVLVKRQRRNN